MAADRYKLFGVYLSEDVFDALDEFLYEDAGVVDYEGVFRSDRLDGPRGRSRVPMPPTGSSRRSWRTSRNCTTRRISRPLEALIPTRSSSPISQPIPRRSPPLANAFRRPPRSRDRPPDGPHRDPRHFLAGSQHTRALIPGATGTAEPVGSAVSSDEETIRISSCPR